MNERFRELKQQARDFYLAQEDLDCSTKELHELVEQKFAELLIRECAEQIMLKGTDWMDWAPSQQAVRPEYVAMAKHIKQHFGVER